jgi:antirestriction protein ArdC
MRFGKDAYAAEEVIAELSAAFLCADLNVTPSLREDHAQYIANWLKIMKADKKAIFTAAAKANQPLE